MEWVRVWTLYFCSVLVLLTCLPDRKWALTNLISSRGQESNISSNQDNVEASLCQLQCELLSNTIRRARDDGPGAFLRAKLLQLVRDMRFQFFTTRGWHSRLSQEAQKSGAKHKATGRLYEQH